MKQYDKNSLIGFVLMAIILIVFNTFFFPEVPQEKSMPVNEVTLTKPQITERTTEPIINSLVNDTTISEELRRNYGVFANTTIGEETFHTIENDKLSL